MKEYRNYFILCWIIFFILTIIIWSVILYSMGFWDNYSWELVLVSFFIFTLPITTILALFTAYIIITRDSKQRTALKNARQERHDKYEEKREKIREIKKLEREKQETEEKDQYDNIPNLQELIQNYVYHQLKLMLNDIDKIIYLLQKHNFMVIIRNIWMILLMKKRRGNISKRKKRFQSKHSVNYNSMNGRMYGKKIPNLSLIR